MNQTQLMDSFSLISGPYVAAHEKALASLLAKQFAHDLAHPLRECRQAGAQIVADCSPVIGVAENRDKPAPELSVIGGEHVAEPIERLHEAHGWAPRPVEAAGRGMAKLDGEFPESDGTQARIREYGDARRNRVSQTQIVGSGDTVHDHSNVVLASERIDHSARVGRGGLSSKAIGARNVIEAPSNAAQFPGSHQAVENLVNRSARSEIGEVLRTPDADFPLSGKALSNGGSDAWCPFGKPA